MSTNRILYRYHFKMGNKIVLTGITYDIYRRQNELKREYGDKGHIVQVGFRTTLEAALEWEAEQRKLGKPVRSLKSIKSVVGGQ